MIVRKANLINRCKFKGCPMPGTERAVLNRTGEVIGLCPYHYEYFSKRNALTSHPRKVITETHRLQPTIPQPRFHPPLPKA